MCAKNRRKNLHKHPGPPFQIRPGPGCFSIALFSKRILTMIGTELLATLSKSLKNLSKATK